MKRDEAFLETLRGEGDDWARAKRRAFRSLCRDFDDADSIPTSTLLRQIAEGRLDDRLGEWKAVFQEVLRQWLGFEMEAEAARTEPFGSFGWWFQPFAPLLVVFHKWGVGWAGPGIMVLIAIAALLTSPLMRKKSSGEPPADDDGDKPAEASA